METTADFARRYVVPQGRSLTVNITGFQSLGFVDGQPLDVTVNPEDGSLTLRLAMGPRARDLRTAQIVQEARHNLPPGTLKTEEPRAPINHSGTYSYVRAFGRIMEGKLQANRHKGDREGWVESRPLDLLERVTEELDELLAAVFHRESDEVVAKEAADVANMAMMVADAYIHQHSLGAASILDLQPEEWAIAPIHGGIRTYKQELERIATRVFHLGDNPTAQVIRELTANLVAYVEGL
jgi:NTP pyrophosphatase (non-canonical NTP hydrolase)